ncbi:MAG: PA14 domain-containing protein [Bacteroidota bacterium]
MSVVVLELEGKYEMEPALEIKNPKPGIKFDYYEGIWENLPAFNLLSPKHSGIIEQFVLPKETTEENFAVQYSGYIKVSVEGLYTFYVNSDDGADITIDKTIVVDNDGRHAPQELSGVLMLRPGFHEIKVTFFQAGGGKMLDISLEGPGLSKRIIPADMLFH